MLSTVINPANEAGDIVVLPTAEAIQHTSPDNINAQQDHEA